MPLSERIEQLNREIGAAMERTLSEVRHEAVERLRAGSEEIARQLAELGPRLPTSFLAHEDLAGAIEEVRH
nr:hypothetical protein [Acidobacteriota bacterium]